MIGKVSSGDKNLGVNIWNTRKQLNKMIQILTFKIESHQEFKK